jgi:hypothetical protein
MRDALRAGFRAMVSQRRLAAVLWLSLVLPAGIACTALGPLTRLLDAGPSGAALVKGWDSWAILSWYATRAAQWKGTLAVVLVTLLAGWLLQLFLTGGLLRVLVAGVRRPVLGRVVVESAALFKVNLWATGRYLASLAFWLGGIGGGVAWLLGKGAGTSAPPESLWFSARDLWLLSVGLLGFFLVSLRFDLARIALARGDAGTARAAYRLAGARIRGHRATLLGIALFWSAVALALGSIFTRIGISMNPGTGRALLALILFRQAGFAVQAAARIGFWASLLRFDEERQDDLAGRTIPVPDDPVPAPAAPPGPLPADLPAAAS